MKQLWILVKPPKSLEEKDDVVRWILWQDIAMKAVLVFVVWAMGYASAVGFGVFGGGFARAGELVDLKLAFACSNIQAAMERLDEQIYEVRREIDSQPQPRDIDQRRLVELSGKKEAETRRYIANGCDKVL